MIKTNIKAHFSTFCDSLLSIEFVEYMYDDFHRVCFLES